MPFVSTTSGRRFAAAEGESILDAALREGLPLAYSCRTGRCNSCKARQIGGSTAALQQELGLDDGQRDAGWILACSRTAVSDVDIEVEDLGDVRLPAAKTFPCRIQSLEMLTADIIKVMLRLPPSMAVDFLPGQYVDIIGPGGVRRSYSIANAPRADRQLELHIRRVPGGALSAYWFESARVNDLLRLHGPQGTFFLRDWAGVDLLFLATGTGLAPVKAMVEHLCTTNRGFQSLSLLWGMRTQDELYWRPEADGTPHRFVPVLSRADAAWSGARGHVQQIAVEGQRDWTRTAVYACGSQAMIDDARRVLVKAGLNERRFFADAFVCSAPN